MLIQLRFRGEVQVESVEPQGMMLHSLVCEPLEGPTWRFTFVNWSDSDSRSLAVVARECRWRSSAEGQWQAV
jgi:hypothetical protein